MGSQAVSLIWKDHKNNMIGQLHELFSKESFLDVTLVCNDGFSLKANKSVLSANSPFFHSLFLNNPCRHPVIIMTDVDKAVLECIVEFMYKGKIDVSWETLAQVLKAGKRFKIKGIMSISQNIRRSVEKHNAALLSSSNSTTTIDNLNAVLTQTNVIVENQNTSLETNLSCQEDSRIDAYSEHSYQKKQDSLNIISQEEFPQSCCEVDNSLISSVQPAMTTFAHEQSIQIPPCGEIEYDTCSGLDVPTNTVNDATLPTSHEMTNSDTLHFQSCALDVEREVEITDSNLIMPFSPDSRYLCGVCNRFCHCKSRLEAHIRTHTGERPYSCEDCGKCFGDKSTFRVHKRVHSGEKPFKCTVCEKSFSIKSTLERHRWVHTNEKPFSCHLCKRRFGSKSSLLVHIRGQHSGQRPFSCNFCNRRFTTKHTLKNHQLLEHYEKMCELNDITR